MDEQYVTRIALRQYLSSSSYNEQETVAASHLGVSAIRHPHLPTTSRSPYHAYRAPSVAGIPVKATVPSHS